MAGEQTLVQVVPPDSLIARRSQTGRNYWIATDHNNVEWRIWDAQLALLYTTLYGQNAIWGVRIAPAKDPKFGMNYELKSLAAVNGNVAQGVQAQMPGQPQLPQPEDAYGQGAPQPIVQQPSPLPIVTPQTPVLPSPPSQTLGQGGSFSDADITRMARSTAVEAVSRLMMVAADEFKTGEGKLDWTKLYAAAEALSKFITHRSHQGWEPGVELAPSVNREQQVIAEVEAQFPGAVVQGMPEVPEDSSPASAENADGGEIDWQ